MLYDYELGTDVEESGRGLFRDAPEGTEENQEEVSVGDGDFN
jgi:hypothetical protein